MIPGDVKEENAVMDSTGMDLKQFMRFDQGITVEDVLTEHAMKQPNVPLLIFEMGFAGEADYIANTSIIEIKLADTSLKNLESNKKLPYLTNKPQ